MWLAPASATLTMINVEREETGKVLGLEMGADDYIIKPFGSRVRQVAVDEDWTAMRFRCVEFARTMERRESFALTKQGKAKTKK